MEFRRLTNLSLMIPGDFKLDFKSGCQRDFQVTIDEDLIRNFHGYIERNFERYCKLDI